MTNYLLTNELTKKPKNPKLHDYCLEKAVYERNLAEFLKASWGNYESKRSFIWNWHLDAICEYLTAIERGQIQNLVINVPPRSTKSLSVAVAYPSWVWTTKPWKRFIKVSYSYRLSTKHNVIARKLINSKWYQNYWKVILSHDTNQKEMFENLDSGFMFATSIGGMLTGEGGDCIIIDDPQKPDEAFSETVRENVITFFKNTLATRLNDQETGNMICIMQRLHEADAANHFINELGWDKLILPAKAEERQTIYFPISKTYKIREKDDLLDPIRLSQKTLDKMWVNMGPQYFSAQFQQNPTPAEGIIFKQEMFTHYFDAVPESAEWFSFWDMPFKKGENTAECACIIAAQDGMMVYIIDLVHRKMAFTDICNEFRSIHDKYIEVRKKIVEDAAAAQSVSDTLHKTIPGIILVKPKGSKEERARATTGYWLSGNILLPDPSLHQPWVEDFKNQLLGFPKMILKDIVDAMSLGIIYCMKPEKSDEEMPTAIEKNSYWKGG
jgi:predicted phage terminase large subunit-like protein